MTLYFTAVSTLLAMASGSITFLAYGQQVPARTTALPGTPAYLAGGLTGTVANRATGQAIAYASVAVLTTAGTPVNGSICGDDGQFVLPGLAPGTYTLRVSSLGYQDLVRPGLVIPAAGGTVALGTLVLVPAPQELGEVVVTARRPLIEEKADRTIYNAEQDQTTRGGDATDVLRHVPLLSVDLDGNVSVRGSQNIKVLINNKPSTITANSIADGLRQIPADQIKVVEVITSPSAKYDAEGSGGIINIVTKTNTLRGGQLSLDGSGGTRSGTLNLNGGYRTGKMGFALGGFGRASYNTPGSFTNNQVTTNPATGRQTRTTQTAATRQSQLFGRYTLGWDYELSPRHFLAASLAYGTRNATTYQDALATGTTPLATGSTATSVRNVKTTDESGTVDATFSYTHTYERAQRELSVLALFSRNDRVVPAAATATRRPTKLRPYLSDSPHCTSKTRPRSSRATESAVCLPKGWFNSGAFTPGSRSRTSPARPESALRKYRHLVPVAHCHTPARCPATEPPPEQEPEAAYGPPWPLPPYTCAAAGRLQVSALTAGSALNSCIAQTHLRMALLRIFTSR